MPFAEKVQLNFDKLMVRKVGSPPLICEYKFIRYGVLGFTSGLPC
jgi:hypothetical protein